MFRNTLCEAEPGEPGERSAFGAIRTGIELCKRQPRQSSGSIGPAGPRAGRNAGCRTYRTSRGDGPDRRARERKSKCSSFCPPYSAVFGIPAVQAMTGIVSPTRIIARTALRTATYERRRLEQHIRNGSGPMREPAANGAERKPGHRSARCRDRQPSTATTCPNRKVAPYRATTADRTRRTSRRGRSSRPCRGFSHRYCRSADTQMRTPRNPSTSFHGRRPVRR